MNVNEMMEKWMQYGERYAEMAQQRMKLQQAMEDLGRGGVVFVTIKSVVVKVSVEAMLHALQRDLNQIEADLECLTRDTLGIVSDLPDYPLYNDGEKEEDIPRVITTAVGTGN